MAEKEEQLQQLAKDRAELSSKLETLQTMVTSVMSGPDQATREVEATADMAVSAKMKESLEKENAKMEQMHRDDLANKEKIY